MADLNFDSTVNYQKIYMQGSYSASIANPNSQQVTTITHSLGYIPNVKVWFTNAAGKICPVLSSTFGDNLFPITSDFSSYSSFFQIYDQTLKIYFDRLVTVGPTVTSTFYYRIYLDAAS